jgi:beta-galactosidase
MIENHVSCLVGSYFHTLGSRMNMQIGAYYYPEQWPRSQWERDFDRIAQMGMQIVHMAEFAWHDLEPRPGEFHFDWLAQCIQLAAQRGLGVILCTPTAAPPVWLMHQHPDIAPIDENGRRVRLGGRRHYSPTSPALQEATVRIVGALAERFAAEPSIIGWQIDNEYSSGFFDQNDHAHAAFRDWLRRRYQSIEALNAAWGCQFWNQYYDDFEQIRLPGTRDPQYGNPHPILDASRFWSRAFADFNAMQADILKKKLPVVRSQPSTFISTNFMPANAGIDCDPMDMIDDLSLFSWDAYPVSGSEPDIATQHFRMAEPSQLGFMHDLMASYTGRWSQMELQLGQVNWSGVPVRLYPGAVRLWIWTAFAHGAEFVTTYRFRQARFGVELFHNALIGPDGTTLAQGGVEFQQAAQELKRLSSPTNPKSDIQNSKSGPPSIGLVFDFEQTWWHRILPQAKRWDQWKWYERWHAAFSRLGLSVKILHPGRTWPEDLPLIVAPGLQMVDDDLLLRFDAYARNGGHLLLTCRTALMDRDGQLFEGPTAAPILPLIGGSIEAYDGMPEGTFGQLRFEGDTHPYQWGIWGDMIRPNSGTHVLARYTDQFYADAAAVTQNKFHAGTVTYCGVNAEAPFIDALAERLARQAHLPITPLPPRVRLMSRGPWRICLNYQDTPFDAPVPIDAEFAVGARTVEPAGVAVWRARET